MEVPKKIRFEDRAFLDSFHGMKCEACGISEYVVGHHVKSKKSGGPDLPWNILAACISCHQTVHKIGLSAFAKRHHRVKEWLIKHNWNFNISKNKWTHYEG